MLRINRFTYLIVDFVKDDLVIAAREQSTKSVHSAQWMQCTMLQNFYTTTLYKCTECVRYVAYTYLSVQNV